ncbi:hypothetical protein AR686_00455 [Chryseobacterium aquaticum subsp. greenlandense]|uniref:Phytanoyl-CoA dioxygenase n=1 Tax=Chryseobacterium aquaticum subsp. greenlandense TaxID=345663 RepID=A0A101CLC3_9FLAO|nr:hypothetical protein AR686_00455 [Chryseobacterium aquaticum subsp. greenlandense]
MNLQQHKNQITDCGFSVISNVYSTEEIERISEFIQNIDTSKDTFRKSEDLFAIRQFLKEIPEVKDLIFNENLKTIIREIFGENYFVVKSICISVFPHTAVILAIMSLSKSLSPKYLLFSL